MIFKSSDVNCLLILIVRYPCRGSFFQEMRTTEVRALLPDAWGFICPVHTPDGSPCGLLNHLAMPVEIVTHAQDASKIPQVLVNLGRAIEFPNRDCLIQ